MPIASKVTAIPFTPVSGCGRKVSIGVTDQMISHSRRARGQEAQVDCHHRWKVLSAMAGVTWWNFYFRLFPGAIRSPQIIEFLSHLMRHIPGKLLIVWDGLTGHRSRMTWEFICQQRGRLCRVSTRLCFGSEPGRILVVALEATRVAQLLPAELWPAEPLCSQGSAADAEAALAGDRLLAASGTVSVAKCPAS
jgi:hypothetical protein